MASAPYVDPEPGALGERCAWEIETKQSSEAESEEFDQLRLDLVEVRKRETKARRDRIRSIEAQFEAER